MNPSESYERLRLWAASLKVPLPDVSDASLRVRALADAIAKIRLSGPDHPTEPDRALVHTLVSAAFTDAQDHPDLDLKMETLIMEAMQNKIRVSEQQAFNSCRKSCGE